MQDVRFSPLLSHFLIFFPIPAKFLVKRTNLFFLLILSASHTSRLLSMAQKMCAILQMDALEIYGLQAQLGSQNSLANILLLLGKVSTVIHLSSYSYSTHIFPIPSPSVSL